MTAPGETLVPVNTRRTEQLIQDVSGLSAQRSHRHNRPSFFKRLTFTLSIGTTF